MFLKLMIFIKLFIIIELNFENQLKFMQSLSLILNSINSELKTMTPLQK